MRSFLWKVLALAAHASASSTTSSASTSSLVSTAGETGTSSGAVGDFIASGIGLISTPSSTPSAPPSSSPSSQPSSARSLSSTVSTSVSNPTFSSSSTSATSRVSAASSGSQSPTGTLQNVTTARTATVIFDGGPQTISAVGSEILEGGQPLTVTGQSLSLGPSGLVQFSPVSGTLTAITTYPTLGSICIPQTGTPAPTIPPETGSGSAFASSCSTALREWSSSSESFLDLCATTTKYTNVYVRSAPYASKLPQTIPDSGVTTLCDGFPRIIGAPREVMRVFNYTTMTDSITTWSLPTGVSYTDSQPCSINPSDCSALWSVYRTSNETNVGLPPCRTNTDVPTMDPSKCTNNIVSATEAQLIYWPATAASQSKYFCAEPSSTGPYSPGDEGVNTTTVFSGSTLTYLSFTAPSQTPFYPSPTADGPNTVVIGSVTVTSPSVAINWKGIGRWDGCGPTISTIAVYDPTQIKTARGYGIGASYAIMPMNWADLNWRCPSAEGNGTYTTAVGPDGNKCYQDVAAHAYWLGKDQAGAWLSANRATTPVNKATMTMSPDYRVWISQDPFPIDVFNSYWGEGAAWLPNGMWDPPSAVQLGTAVASATLPAGVAASTTASSAAETTPATPASPTTVPQVSVTPDPLSVASPISTSSAQATPVSSQQTSSVVITLQPQTSTPTKETTVQGQSSDPAGATTRLEQSGTGVGASSGQAQTTTQNTLPSGNTPSNTGSQNSASSGENNVSAGGTVVTVEPTTTPAVSTTAVVSAPQVVTIGSSTLTASASGAVVVVDSQTLSVGGSATTAAGQVVSAASGGIVVGTGSTATTISIETAATQTPAAVAQTGVVTIGTSAVTFVSSTGSAVVVGTATLSVGGTAAIVAGQTISAVSTGLVIGTGTSAQTIGLATGAPAAVAQTGVVTIGTSAVTIVSSAGSAVVVGTATLSVGGTAAIIAGQTISAVSTGLIIGTGTSAQTIGLTTGAPAPTGAVVALPQTTLTASQAGSNIAIGSTTLTPGGAATSIDGQLVSAVSSGIVVVGTGSTARTLALTRLATASSSTSALSASSASSSSSSTSSVTTKMVTSTPASSSVAPTTSHTASSTTTTGAAPQTLSAFSFWMHLSAIVVTAIFMSLF